MVPDRTKSRLIQRIAVAFTLIVLVYGFVSYSMHNKPVTNTKTAAPPEEKVIISGAGSSFAFPIYTKMIDEYRTRSGTETTYQSIGSGAGIKELISRNVDFGASDVFLSKDEMTMFPSAVVQFPTCL